jgi:hypothetical protein
MRVSWPSSTAVSTALERLVRAELSRAALLEAGADVMQLGNNGTCALQPAARSQSLEILQLICAYAPSRDAVRAHLPPGALYQLACAQWFDATRRWTSPLHHFAFMPLERVRALLVAGADVRAGNAEADALTPLRLAEARLLRGDGCDDGRAALIVAGAAPWSPKTHALFPAAAKAFAVEAPRVGWLLARRLQGLVADTTRWRWRSATRGWATSCRTRSSARRADE